MSRNLEFSHFLIARMSAQGTTSAALAAVVGVSGTAVSNWRKGTTPKSSLVSAISAALHADPQEVARLAGYGMQAPSDHVGGTASASLAERLAGVVASLPADRLRELLDFAEYLGMKDWREDQKRFALASLAQAYVMTSRSTRWLMCRANFSHGNARGSGPCSPPRRDRPARNGRPNYCTRRDSAAEMAPRTSAL